MKNRWTSSLRWACALCALSATVSPSFAAPASAQDPAGRAGEAQKPGENQKYMRFVRAAANGAKVRSIYDAQATVVGEVPAHGILAVYGERAGWLDVELPGGVQVWVYGEFVRSTNDPGVLEITGNEVRMRPMPSRETDAMPLRQSLSKGEKVRLIARRDVGLDLAKDWVQVWSPVGTRAWVAAKDTEALPAGTDGAASWSVAVAAARRPAAPTAAAAPSVQQPAGSSAPRTVAEALSAAESKFAEARQRAASDQAPEITAVRAAFQAVLALGPDDSVRERVEQRLSACDTMQQMWEMKVQLEETKARDAAAQLAREKELEEAKLRASSGGKFDGRGWVTRRNYAGVDGPVYVVEFGNEAVAELRCTTGRFDLADFVDCEVGYIGVQAAGPTRSAMPGQSRPAAVDVRQIEIMALRTPRR